MRNKTDKVNITLDIYYSNRTKLFITFCNLLPVICVHDTHFLAYHVSSLTSLESSTLRKIERFEWYY